MKLTVFIKSCEFNVNVSLTSLRPRAESQYPLNLNFPDPALALQVSYCTNSFYKKRIVTIHSLSLSSL